VPRPPGTDPSPQTGPAAPSRPFPPVESPPPPTPTPTPAITLEANTASPVAPANAAPPVFIPHPETRPATPVGGATADAATTAPVQPVAPRPAMIGPDRNGQCTAPQLRRFIKSRPYVPMHELRRRFGINGGDDDVTPVRLEPGWVYVGLPSREGMLLGELLRAGEIGYELSLDPRSPIVIGVYPMRPIPRG